MTQLTREELVDRVRRIIEMRGTDEELEALAKEVNANVAHPDIIDLIYDDEQTMTPEEIVNRALSYKPHAIQLHASPSETDNEEDQ
jgi:hypothetical protein